MDNDNANITVSDVTVTEGGDAVYQLAAGDVSAGSVMLMQQRRFSYSRIRLHCW
jgi:hypothetical protein